MRLVGSALLSMRNFCGDEGRGLSRVVVSCWQKVRDEIVLIKQIADVKANSVTHTFFFYTFAQV